MSEQSGVVVPDSVMSSLPMPTPSGCEISQDLLPLPVPGGWGMLTLQPADGGAEHPEFIPRAVLLRRSNCAIGRLRSKADVEIKLPFISGVHCKITLVPVTTASIGDAAAGAVLPRVMPSLHDLSSNGTYVNDRKVGKQGAPVHLRHGDRIKFGNSPGNGGTAPKNILPTYVFHFASCAASVDSCADAGADAPEAARADAPPPLPDAICAQAMIDALDAEVDEASMPPAIHRARTSAYDVVTGGAAAGGGAAMIGAGANTAAATAQRSSKSSQRREHSAKRKHDGGGSSGSGGGSGSGDDCGASVASASSTTPNAGISVSAARRAKSPRTEERCEERGRSDHGGGRAGAATAAVASAAASASQAAGIAQELASLRAKLAAAETRADGAATELARHAAGGSISGEEAAALREELAAARKDGAAARDAWTRELGEARSMTEAAAGKLGAAEARARAAETRHGELESERDELERRLKAEEQARAADATRGSRVQRELEQKSEALSDMTARLDAAVADAATRKRDNMELVEREQATRARAEQLEAKVAAINAELTKRERAAATTAREHANLEQKLANVEHLAPELADARRELAAQRKLNADDRTSLDCARADLDCARTLVTELEGKKRSADAACRQAEAKAASACAAEESARAETDRERKKAAAAEARATRDANYAAECLKMRDVEERNARCAIAEAAELRKLRERDAEVERRRATLALTSHRAAISRMQKQLRRGQAAAALLEGELLSLDKELDEESSGGSGGGGVLSPHVMDDTGLEDEGTETDEDIESTQVDPPKPAASEQRQVQSTAAAGPMGVEAPPAAAVASAAISAAALATSSAQVAVDSPAATTTIDRSSANAVDNTAAAVAGASPSAVATSVSAVTAASPSADAIVATDGAGAAAGGIQGAVAGSGVLKGQSPPSPPHGSGIHGGSSGLGGGGYVNGGGYAYGGGADGDSRIEKSWQKHEDWNVDQESAQSAHPLDEGSGVDNHSNHFNENSSNHLNSAAMEVDGSMAAPLCASASASDAARRHRQQHGYQHEHSEPAASNTECTEAVAMKLANKFS